jgi:hypothetical protein
MVCGGLMIFGGAVCLGCMALEAAADSADDKTTLLEAQRWLAFVGKFAISGSFCAVYVFAAEVYPTVLRSTGKNIPWNIFYISRNWIWIHVWSNRRIFEPVYHPDSSNLDYLPRKYFFYENFNNKFVDFWRFWNCQRRGCVLSTRNKW